MAKDTDENPSTSPTDTDKLTTPAEWELGMPPVVVKILKFIFLCVKK